MRPTISVLMPTYNQEAFIRRALDSLCQQTMTNWELRIVDDGSTDGTAAAVAPYLEDGRIHYQRLAQNQGRGAALLQLNADFTARIVNWLVDQLSG